MKSTYSAKLSIYSLWITILIHVMLTIIGIFIYWQTITQNNHFLLGYGILVLFLLILLIPYLLHPYAYRLSSSHLVIEKKCLHQIIPLEHIKTIQRISPRDLACNMRLFGSGGLWGYFGIFYSSAYGRLIMQVSDHNAMLLVSTIQGKKYVISPSSCEAFLQDWENVKHRLPIVRN